MSHVATVTDPSHTSARRAVAPRPHEGAEAPSTRFGALSSSRLADWVERRVARYTFAHFLVRKFLVERIPAARRARLWERADTTGKMA